MLLYLTLFTCIWWFKNSHFIKADLLFKPQTAVPLRLPPLTDQTPQRSCKNLVLVSGAGLKSHCVLTDLRKKCEIFVLMLCWSVIMWPAVCLQVGVCSVRETPRGPTVKTAGPVSTAGPVPPSAKPAYPAPAPTPPPTAPVTAVSDAPRHSQTALLGQIRARRFYGNVSFCLKCTNVSTVTYCWSYTMVLHFKLGLLGVKKGN